MVLARLQLEFAFLWPVSLGLVLWTAWLCLRRYAVGTGGPAGIGGAGGGVGRVGMDAEGGVPGVGLLPLIRGLVMLLIAVMLLGPVWERPAGTMDAGQVVAVVDLGPTMTVRDEQRSPAERLRLAMALGRYTDSGGDREAAWLSGLSAIEAAGEELVSARAAAEFVELTRSDPGMARRRLQEARRAMADRLQAVLELQGHPAAGAVRRIGMAEEEAGSRAWMEQVRRRLAEGRQAVEAERLRRYSALVTDTSAEGSEASRAAAEISGLTRLQVARMLVSGPGLAGAREVGLGVMGATVPPRMLPLARGSTTGAEDAAWQPATTSDVGAAVRDVVLSSGTKRRVRAVVVLSDGVSIEAGGGAALAEVAASGVPVHGVWVASPSPIPGFRLEGVALPGRAAAGEAVEVVVRVRAVGVSGEAEVVLRVGGTSRSAVVRLAQVEAEAEKPTGSAGRSEEVRFVVVPERAGETAVEVELLSDAAVEGLSRWSGLMRVTADRPAVAVLWGAGGRGRDSLQLESHLRRRPLTTVLPLDLGRMAEAEVITALGQAESAVVADVGPEALTPGVRQALGDLVRRRGGALLLLPGAVGVPTAWASDGELRAWLPGGRTTATADWRWWRSPSASGSLVGAPTAAWQEQAGRAAEWGRLPAAWRHVGTPETGEGAVVLLADATSGRPLLTLGRLGDGRVLLLHTDQAWRWAAGGEWVWDAIARLLVEAPYGAQASGVALDVGQSAVQPGRWVVRVRSLRADGSPGPMPGSSVVLRAGGRTVATGALGPAEGAWGVWAGRYTAEIDRVPEGEYVLQIDGREEPRLTVRVGAGGGGGAGGGDGGGGLMADPSGRREGLAAWTQATGGVLVPAEDVAVLGEVLSRPPPAGELTTVTVRLWNSAGLAVVLLALLSGEWALRKHWGMA